MTNKTSKGKRQQTSEEKRISRQRRILQIVIAIFSILLILSMVLAAVTTY
jgi:hypothetical protein